MAMRRCIVQRPSAALVTKARVGATRNQVDGLGRAQPLHPWHGWFVRFVSVRTQRQGLWALYFMQRSDSRDACSQEMQHKHRLLKICVRE